MFVFHVRQPPYLCSFAIYDMLASGIVRNLCTKLNLLNVSKYIQSLVFDRLKGTNLSIDQFIAEYVQY